MKRISLLLFVTFTAFKFAALVAAQQSPASSDHLHFNGQSWWDKVKVLADDKMEGRDTGSAGERAAQQYAIEQFKAAGVAPAGVNGFYQPVKFISRKIVESESSLALIRDGKREPLVLGDDAIISARVMPAPHVEAGLVFVGYGLKIPEANYDDFAGLDVKGKLVVIISGSPAGVSGAVASHYQTLAERWKVLKNAGAVGIVNIMNPALVEVPWRRIALNRSQPSMDLDYPEFEETAGEQLSAYINPAKAERLFEGSGHTFADVAALAKAHQPLPHFPLTVSLEAKTKVDVAKVESANLVGRLPGSDPALKDEYVVLSAHLDHLGVAEPVNGDRIYNGAMDNGSGSALLLDLAESLHKDPAKLRRSVLFVLVTGEEKGLLGSKYFTAHPTAPLKSMVADINVDMFLPIIPLKVFTVYGLAESDLGDRVKEAAQAVGVPVQPDPEPQRNVFIRSDQYNFIRHGIPSMMMDVGAVPGSPEAAALREWRHTRYHAPSDDVNQPVDLQTEAKYEEVIRGLTINVANEDRRPEWKADSFFRNYAENGSSQLPKSAATNGPDAKQGAASPGERGRILGIGGIFFKSANQPRTREWYAQHLGLADKGGGFMLPWREKDSPEKEHVTAWTVFPENTKYFEPGQAFMVDYIVDDLDALLERLQKEGVKIDPKRQEADFGRFAWIYDPDGNKVELWQPLTPNKK